MATERKWSKKKYRVGIIGCGFTGVSAPDSHFRAYRECPHTELIALSDIDLWRIPWGWQEHAEYMEMVCAEHLDIVSVCTPVETRCQIVCDIAPYVKAIYCEKPIALTLEEADRMIETCHKHGVILQINHQRLFMKPVFRFSGDNINIGTHIFSLINHLFREGIEIEVEQVDTNERIFELDCTHTKEPMILKGVEHLVECLNEGKESVSSGESARQALTDCLEHIEENTTIIKVGKRKWFKVVPFRP